MIARALGMTGLLVGLPALAEEPAAETSEPVAVPAYDPGTGLNMFGGRVVPNKTIQGYLTAGYADAEVGVRLGFGLFELTPRARFGFPGGGFSFTAGAFTLSPGLDGRVQLMEQGPLSGALVVSIPAHMGFTPGSDPLFGVGLLHPGWMMTWTLADLLDIDFGIQLQADLMFTPGDVTFLMGTPIILGLEGEVIDRLQVGFRFEAGPSLALRKDTTAAVGGRIRAVLGVGYTF